MANEWQPVEVLVNTPEIAGKGGTSAPAGVAVQPRVPSNVVVLPDSQNVSTPLSVYNRAYNLIAHGWIKGREAVTAEGQPCKPEDERADKWCVIGSWKAAIHYEPDTIDHDYMYKYMNSLWNTANLNHMINMDHPNPPTLNDGYNTEHSLILRCFEKVINHLVRHPESNVWYPRQKK